MRQLKWLAMAAGLVTTSVASATPAATIKREVPLNTISHGTKGTPAVLSTGGSARGIAFDGMQIWVLNSGSDTVQRFDYQSNVLKGTYNLPAGSDPTDVVFDGTYAWVFTGVAGGSLGGQVFKFKTDGSKVNGFPVALPSYVWGAIFDGDYIWVGLVDNGLLRIQASSGSMTTFPGFTSGSLAFDGHDVWLASAWGGIAKIDGITGATLYYDGWYDGPQSVKGVAFDGRFVWVARPGGGVIDKWDPTTNTVVASVVSASEPRSMAFDGTYLWVACGFAHSVIKVDVRLNQVIDAIPFPSDMWPYNAAFDGTHVWVIANQDGGGGKLYKFFAKFN